MRRGFVFFAISATLFIIALLSVRAFAPDGNVVLTAGIVAIALGLIYALLPVPSTKALALVPCSSLGVIYFALALTRILAFGVVSFACMLFPAGVGYVLVRQTMPRLGQIGVIVIVIVYLTVWLVLLRYQWRMARGVWRIGEDAHETLVAPVGSAVKSVWHRAGELGEWVRK